MHGGGNGGTEVLDIPWLSCRHCDGVGDVISLSMAETGRAIVWRVKSELSPYSGEGGSADWLRP